MLRENVFTIYVQSWTKIIWATAKNGDVLTPQAMPLFVFSFLVTL